MQRITTIISVLRFFICKSCLLFKEGKLNVAKLDLKTVKIEKFVKYFFFIS